MGQTREVAAGPGDGGFGALGVVLRVFCAVPFLTGAADLLGGTGILEAAGAVLPPEARADPTLNNQIGFWGAIWFGYGMALWWTSGRLRSGAGMFRILMGTLFLSGLGRAWAVAQHGWAVPALSVAMTVELAGAALLLLWHARLLARG